MRRTPIVRVFWRKRIFDLVFAACVTTMLLSWLLPLLAVIIKLESRGPVLFKQLRTGKNGKPFYCYKLRTMYLNEDSDHRQTSRGDTRITPFGSFLRKASLDELPQFINVLRGEMSVVGPRPHMLQHTIIYSQLIDNFMERHCVAPGITGLAQVSGYRGEIRENEAIVKRVHADMLYISNWSFRLDLKIVLLTIHQTVRGHENAF